MHFRYCGVGCLGSLPTFHHTLTYISIVCVFRHSQVRIRAAVSRLYDLWPQALRAYIPPSGPPSLTLSLRPRKSLVSTLDLTTPFREYCCTSSATHACYTTLATLPLLHHPCYTTTLATPTALYSSEACRPSTYSSSRDVACSRSIYSCHRCRPPSPVKTPSPGYLLHRAGGINPCSGLHEALPCGYSKPHTRQTQDVEQLLGPYRRRNSYAGADSTSRNSSGGLHGGRPRKGVGTQSS